MASSFRSADGVVPSSLDPTRRKRQVAANLFLGGNRAPPSSSNNTNNNTKTTKSKRKSTAQPRPEIRVVEKQFGPISEPNVHDVLKGRGGRINAHAGNVQLRVMVAARRDDYLKESTKKLEKGHIAAEIVYSIRAMDPPGRFLEEGDDGCWWEIGDKKAIKKVGQALREQGNKHASESAAEDGKQPSKSPKAVKSATKKPKATSSTKKVKPDATIKSNSFTGSPMHKAAQAVSKRGGGTPRMASMPPRTSSEGVSEFQHHPSVLNYETVGAAGSSNDLLPPPSLNPSSFAGFRNTSAAVSGAAAAFMDEPEMDVAFGLHFSPVGGPPLQSQPPTDNRLYVDCQPEGSAVSGLTDGMSDIGGGSGTTNDQRMARLRENMQNWTNSSSNNKQPVSPARVTYPPPPPRAYAIQTFRNELSNLDDMSWIQSSVSGGNQRLDSGHGASIDALSLEDGSHGSFLNGQFQPSSSLLSGVSRPNRGFGNPGSSLMGSSLMGDDISRNYRPTDDASQMDMSQISQGIDGLDLATIEGSSIASGARFAHI